MLNHWLQRIAPATLVLSLAIAMVTVRGQQPSQTTASYVENELLVKFRPQASAPRRQAALAAKRAQRISSSADRSRGCGEYSTPVDVH